MLNDQGFDLWADDYDRSVNLSDEEQAYPFAGYKKVLAKIYNSIRAGEGKRVLDVGFGTAVLAARLYADGYSITGIDFSEKMLDIAKAKMPNAHLILHDFSAGLPEELAKQEFDYVVCTYAIHHLTDPAKVCFIEQLQQHLSPNGVLLIGDVAFSARKELEECKAHSARDWDDDEMYIVADELSVHVPGLVFERMSHCAGLLTVFPAVTTE